MIAAGLFDLLSADAQISALCGARIYPLILPGNPAFPALTMQVIASTSKPTFSTSGMQRLRIQFDCWASYYADATSLREALRKALDGYVGLLSDGTYLQNADLLQETDYFQDDARIYRCMMEFYLYFNFQN